VRFRSMALLTVFLFLFAGRTFAQPVAVGSKKFTENVILGEMAALMARNQGLRVKHRRELGGTRILWNALIKGEIDVYPEYTGTVIKEILHSRNLPADAPLNGVLAEFGVAQTPPLGFNNTYAIGMKRAAAESLGIRTISDLRRFPDLQLGFTNEFLDRGDGWKGLRRRYSLPHRNVRGLDHDLAYRGIASGSIQVIDMYSTDAEIALYDLAELTDDAGYFPAYNAVFLYRLDLAERAPAFAGQLKSLGGKIPATEMIAMNARAKIDRVPETQVAADFLAMRLGLTVDSQAEGFGSRLMRTTRDHLVLVLISLTAAILFSVPLGIIAAKHERTGKVILGVAGVIQTIPSLALLVFMIPLLGIGGPPAVVALFLYSLLPIVRNTHSGLQDISPSIRESALALGLPACTRLRRIELPLASRSILAGIKTSAVINVGTATLGALIGAGGYGQPILTGIRLNDTSLILEGAVPAAILALLVQGIFDLADRVLVPRGLRLKPETANIPRGGET
jgi:osmoprotectant transport system permease protein